MIVSASRRTDIPAFYADWFFNRIKEGFVYVRNPINQSLISKVSLRPEHVDCFVFWTKNPLPFMERLSLLDPYKYYFQYTITAYSSDLEPFVPQEQELTNTFIELSKQIGKERVIWRYDPILISTKYNLQYHLTQFETIANKIAPYTQKCIISFIDLYKKSQKNLSDTDVRELCEEEMLELAKGLKAIANKHHLILETCAESIDLGRLGINHGRCIDNLLIEEILGKKINVSKDKNQRAQCGCVESVDIGTYNTCTHGCLYCYANTNQEVVTRNVLKHSATSPLLFGVVAETDVVKERENKSIIKML